jgi:uncharacterized protein HemY
VREKLEKLLAAGQDSAMLRFGLGRACMEAQDWTAAEKHLRAAIRQQPDYSAAWQLLGQALLSSGSLQKAKSALEEGLEVAHKKGDQQAFKVMQVLLKRVLKAQAQ